MLFARAPSRYWHGQRAGGGLGKVSERRSFCSGLQNYDSWPTVVVKITTIVVKITTIVGILTTITTIVGILTTIVVVLTTRTRELHFKNQLASPTKSVYFRDSSKLRGIS